MAKKNNSEIENENVVQQAEKENKTQEQAQAPEKKEITIKTAKGLVGEPFKAKDGKEYCEVKIPNKDENDKSPWKSFVVRASQIHDDKFGKGKWFKLPAEGTTTVSQSVITGQDEQGKNVYENQKERVTNSELKDMVEFYKDRDRSQEQDKAQVPFDEKKAKEEMVADKPATAKSFKDQIKEAKAEAKKENEKAPEQAKAKAKTKTKGQEI